MSVGESLRKAREAKGLSLEDIKNSTQIMTRQLQEMESDDFSSFAAPIYAKGFIRLFARAVGLDPTPLVAEFSSQPMKPSAGGPAPRPAAAALAATPKAAPAETPAPAAVPAESAPQSAAPASEAAAAEPTDGDDLFSLAANPRKTETPPGTAAEPAAPAVAKNVEPAPAPESAAPPKAAAKVVAATPLEFERRPAPQPQPEKRVAALEPGVPAPVPPPSPRAEMRPGERADFVPPPAAKKLPEQQSAAFHSSSLGRPVAPDPLPLDGPAFRFPEPRPLPRAAAPAAPAPKAAASAAPVTAPVAASPLQPRQRKSFGMVGDDEDLVAKDAPAPKPAAPAAPDDEDIVARDAPKKRREPRPDAPNAASLFLSNLAASTRKAFGKPGRVPLLAGAAAVVALCVAGGVYLATGRGGETGSATGETSAPAFPTATVTPAADSAVPPEPPEDIAPVFPPPASWAK